MPHLVLLGGGHAHSLVLNRWIEGPPPEAELTVVSEEPHLLYSGMIPGLVGGEYRPSELTVDVEDLTRRAGGRFVRGRAAEVEPERRRILLDDGAALDFDLLSLDVGSATAGWDDVAGAAVQAAPPHRLLGRLAELEGLAEPSTVVVGGGAAGVEIAAAIRRRLPGARVTVLERKSRLVDGLHPRVSGAVREALRAREVEVRTSTSVEEVRPGRVELSGGTTLESDLTVWATGAAPRPLLRRSRLPEDGQGFVPVNRHLQVEEHPWLFAVGDCAGLVGRPVPKAGVYAVRQAPVLAENLRTVAATIASGKAIDTGATELRRYTPQSHMLTILNLGDGRALATKWGWAVEGRWVRRLKDWIDRRFVERFRG